MNRITALNLARGFTVCMIAPVHTILIYSDPIIYNTVLVKCLAFIAEGPGAQLFMCIMGIYFALSSKNTWQSVITKAAILLAAAYALNALKFVIPYLFGGLPAPMLTDLQIQTARPGDHGQPEWLQLLLIGDIFHFSALAMPILFIVKRCPKYQYGAILTALVVMFIAPAAWDIHSENALMNYIGQLIGGQPPQVFFPLFPWLVYPMAGLTIGYYLKQDDLKALPERLEHAVSSLTLQQYAMPYREGGWKISQLVHHLADSHINGYMRFKLALTETCPVIKPYEEKLWAQTSDNERVPPDVSITLLRALHTKWYATIQELKKADWDRTIYHPEYQKELSLWYLLGSYAWHGRHHVAHIMAARRNNDF